MPSTRSYQSPSLSLPQISSLAFLKRRLSLPRRSRKPSRFPVPLIVPQPPRPSSTSSDKAETRGGISDTLLSITPQKLALALPVPPSINHQYATVNGRRVLSSKGRRYKANVAQQILAAVMRSPRKQVLITNLRTHALKLSIRFFFTSALRRDIDGGLKIAQDAICDALEINDNRIIEIHLSKAIDANCPRMECCLSIKRPKKSSTRP